MCSERQRDEKLFEGNASTQKERMGWVHRNEMGLKKDRDEVFFF